MLEKRIMIPENYKYLAVFLSMRCNLHCNFCLNSFDKGEKFNRTKFQEISGIEWVKALNRIESHSEIPITFCGGEPSLHKNFIYIIKNLKSELKIDILTNLYWTEKGIEKFIKEVNPEKINRNSPYPPIRVSYHPEQMKDGEKLVKNTKKLKNAGFDIGIYSVLYPDPKHLQSITQMQFRCADAGILFRIKDFTGEYRGQLYGNYSKYPGCIGSLELKTCLCKTSELIVGPDANVYRCHRDLYVEENPVGNITSPDFEIKDTFRPCQKYGQCHPCDVKIKTNYKQQLGHTSVEIKNVK